MAQWQAPSTNNERDPGDVAIARNVSARPYLAADGAIHWWTGADALPAGSTPLYVIIRASDGHRVFSDDPAGARTPMLFGLSRIHIR